MGSELLAREKSGGGSIPGYAYAYQEGSVGSGWWCEKQFRLGGLMKKWNGATGGKQLLVVFIREPVADRVWE
eukprot:2209600-Pleurochrysis_carterae.AAC.1